MNMAVLCFFVCVSFCSKASEDLKRSSPDSVVSQKGVTFGKDQVSVFDDKNDNLPHQGQIITLGERDALIVKRSQARARVAPSDLDDFYEKEKDYVAKLKGRNDDLPSYISPAKARELSRYYDSVISHQGNVFQENLRILQEFKIYIRRKTIARNSDFKADIDALEMNFDVDKRNNQIDIHYIKTRLNQILTKYETRIITRRAREACIEAYELFKKDMEGYMLKHKEAYKTGMLFLNRIRNEYFGEHSLKADLSIKQLKECFQKAHDRCFDRMCEGDSKAGTQHLFSMDGGKTYESGNTGLRARFSLPTSRGSRLVWVLDDEI